MAGKSTYIRQVALIALMAQMGSFVPAREATIGMADRIFARVGASDELTRGQSTFMVEMTETARILNTATPRSLVILDEIGRGTSTYDGISLAWSVVEYLHDHVGCRTLFATHYHELTDLEKSLSGVKNLNVAVREWQDEVVFLHKIVEGAADKSYGIHVARLAGVPREVIERSKEILAQLEEEHLDAEGRAKIARPRPAEKPTQLQLTLFGRPSIRLLDELRRWTSTPRRRWRRCSCCSAGRQSWRRSGSRSLWSAATCRRFPLVAAVCGQEPMWPGKPAGLAFWLVLRSDIGSNLLAESLVTG